MSEFVQISSATEIDAPASLAGMAARLRRTVTPIIKVVGDFCNLKCTYCFYNQRDQLTPHVMPVELLEKLISETLALYEGKLLFIWHGGEPLLAGKEFFRAVVEFEKRYSTASHLIRNTIQTNATLIDEEWADFFKENQFRVGISLDGGAQSHDMFRQNSGGRGSHSEVLRGISILRSRGLEPGIIQTVTGETSSNAGGDFAFFTETLGLKGWGINAYYAPASDGERHTIDPEELSSFLKKEIDLWLERGDTKLRNREIENFLAGVLGKRPRLCIFNGSCATYICVEHDGRVYPCDRLSGRSDLLLGNLANQSLSDIVFSQARAVYTDAVEHVHPDCATCEWYSACHNGCTHHRVGGITGKYFYCSTRKEVFSYLRDKVNALGGLADGRTEDGIGKGSDEQQIVTERPACSGICN